MLSLSCNILEGVAKLTEGREYHGLREVSPLRAAYLQQHECAVRLHLYNAMIIHCGSSVYMLVSCSHYLDRIHHVLERTLQYLEIRLPKRHHHLHCQSRSTHIRSADSQHHEAWPTSLHIREQQVQLDEATTRSPAPGRTPQKAWRT